MLNPPNTNTVSKDRARILIVAPQPFYEDRGTPISTRRLIEALSERGDIVDLLTFPIGETIEGKGLTIFRIPNIFRIHHVPIGFSIRKLVLDLTMTPIIFKRLRKQRYDSIHAIEEAAFPAVLAARKYGTPVVYDMQSCLPEQLAQHRIFRGRALQRCFRRLERWLIKNSAHVVCSAGLQQYVENIDQAVNSNEWHFPSSNAQISVENLEQLRRELKINPQDRVVLYSGTFERYQGLDIILSAAHRVVEELSNVVFVFVGASSKADYSLGSDAEALTEKGALRVVSRKPRAEIGRYLQLADVLVSPRALGQNIPLKIFDYMGVGKPIVASDCTAHRAVLDDNRAVLVGTPAEEWSNAIISVLQHPEKSKNLGMAARSFADQSLGWSNFQQLVRQLHRHH